MGRGTSLPRMKKEVFSYRIIFFVNEGAGSVKHYIGTPYNRLRQSLETVIRRNLSLTNRVIIAETTALKSGKCVHLQSGQSIII